MKHRISRRDFVRTSLLASAAIPLSGAAAAPEDEPAQAKEAMPLGKMGGQEFSRLMLGGNLIGGYAHSRAHAGACE